MKMELPPPKPRARKAKAAPRWVGAIEGVHNGLVYGWAIDTEQPRARVIIEICLDGEPIGTVSADAARSDLAEAFSQAAAGSDACHGFVADLGVAATSAGLLTARIANSEFALAGSVAWDAMEAPPVGATSLVFSDGGLRLHGWAIDSRRAQHSVTVSAFIGNRRVAQAVANLDHPGLRGQDVGKHGFTLDLPLGLADGQVHTVRVVDEQGVPLNGSPVTLCTYADGAAALLGDAHAPLLRSVIDSYERYIPRSIGFEHYAAWAERFELNDSPANPPALSVGVLVTGDDAAALARTLDSILAQRGVTAHTYLGTTGAAPFAQQLAAARAAKCEVLATLRAGDTLLPHALARALEGFADPAAQVVYTDSEYDGRPWFKPAWNRDYAYATDYPLDLLLVRTSHAGPALAAGAPAAFAWQALAAAQQHEAAIVHVPRALVRIGSPLTPAERDERFAACAAALATSEPDATLQQLAALPPQPQFSARRVVRPLSKKDRARKVSLLIPTRDSVELLERCVASIQRHTDWPGLEILIIDNGSVEKKTKAYFRAVAKDGVKVLPMPGPFNFADLNNRAAATAQGEIIGLINNDIEALHDGWLDEIVAELLRPGVGAVGAKLLWPNGMVQHGGVLMGVGNAAGHFGNQLADADLGDHARNQVTQQMSGVTAACLFLRKRDYQKLGGMDPVAFPVAFNDVDLCLRLRKAGLAITWTPFAKLLHAESASRGKEDSPQKRARAERELEQLRRRWAMELSRDPAYHPSLNLDALSSASSALALPPRRRDPRTGRLA
ncbi:MAG TPA: glycosyltransferase family 2 protein [Telluria sp.]|nr:glycosyltransferase family 2 protein [Telluria sp.]